MKFNLKNIVSALTAALLITGATSCRDDIEIPEQQGPTLRLSTGSILSRASSNDANAEENEEAIRRVTLFFYKDINSTDPAFFITELNVTATANADLYVKIPYDYLGEFTQVDANNMTGYCYALVNLPTTIEADATAKTIDGKPATLENIQEIWVSEPGFANSVLPGNFVMRGGNQIQVAKSAISGQWEATGNINIERLAAKVRLMAELPDEIYIDIHGNALERGVDESDATWEARKAEAVEIWQPAPGAGNGGQGEMKLYFYNMATAGRIDGNTSNRDLMAYTDVDRSDKYENIIRRLHTTDSEKPYYDSKYTFSHDVPYYSYPNKWDSSSPSEDRKSYVRIEMPWKRIYHKTDQTPGEVYQLCYYQIPVNALQSNGFNVDCMEPNVYYRIKVRVGTLGNRDYGDPTLIEDVSYEAVNWVQNSIDVSLKGRRYLVVNQKEWTMNNETNLEVPFSSSHEVMVKGCYVTFFRYNDVWGTDRNAQANGNFESHNKAEFETWLTLADSQLTKPDKNGNTGRNREGAIRLKNGDGSLLTVDGRKRGDILYYKKEYFYDKYYDILGENNGFRYYVGHEHPVTLQPGKISKEAAKNGGENMTNWNKFTTDYSIDSIYTCEIDNERKVVKFNHPLIQWAPHRTNTNEVDYYYPLMNDHSPNDFWDEYSRVEISIIIRHTDWTKDDGNFEETIHITQYPGMYITVSHDYGRPGSSGSEYIVPNGQRIEFEDAWGNGKLYMQSYTPLSTFLGSNNNPNMYLIHTTQLSKEFNTFKIGDPRTLYYNNYLSPAEPQPSGWPQQTPTYADMTSQSLLAIADKASNESISLTYWSGIEYRGDPTYLYEYSTSRRYPTGNIQRIIVPLTFTKAKNIVDNTTNVILRTYYPTDETVGPGSKEDFIAPVFRIASSFGKVAVGYRIEARRRCALYQEAGRPAGRWRLPTKAEIKYIAQLSADGKIPVLLGDNTTLTAYGEYWSAHGGLLVNGRGDVIESTTGQSGHEGVFAPRCVYDEWYWNQIDGGEYPAEIRGDGIGKEALTTTFYWGDTHKDNVQQAMNPLLRSIFKRKK